MNAARLCLCFCLCLLCATGLSLGGCRPQTLVELWAPDGGKPDAPARYKHASTGRSAIPAGANWWTTFRDPQLDGLMRAVAKHNPDVAAAAARVDQANAVLGITGAQRFPTVTGEAAHRSQRDSPNTLRFPIDGLEFENYRLAANASWEIDLWGRLRGAYQRDRFNAEAAGARYQDVLLSLRATAARQYFALRTADREIAILKDAVAARQEALRLQESLAKRGAGTDVDVARARAEVETARAEEEGAARARGKLEHALAILTGRAPSEFDLPRKTSTAAAALPAIPAGVPSTLLERRPDLRAAENALRAAAQQVGITRADFLPRLSLTGTGGIASLNSSTLFAGGDSALFSYGPQLDVPIFQAGRRASAGVEAKAVWREAVENYRAALLIAVREVDDSLLDLRLLKRQLDAQQRAADAAARVTLLAGKRFDQGAASFFEVTDAQRTELQARRTANALRGERAAATVQLAQALGGGW